MWYIHSISVRYMVVTDCKFRLLLRISSVLICIKKIFRKKFLCYDGLMFCICLFYTISMSYYSILKQNAYHTGAYDLGFFDQIFWLLSRGIYPYSTIQGNHILGDHASFL